MFNVIFRLLPRFKFSCKPTLLKCISCLLIFSVVSLIGLSCYVANINHGSKSQKRLSDISLDCNSDRPLPSESSKSGTFKFGEKILLVLEAQYSKHGKLLSEVLEANELRYKAVFARKSLPSLTHNNKGRYAVVIFESIYSYLNLDHWNRQLLDNYCKLYNVGVIAFSNSKSSGEMYEDSSLPLNILQGVSVNKYYLNSLSPVLRILKSSETDIINENDNNWSVFLSNHSSYEALSYCEMKVTPDLPELINQNIPRACAIYDRGYFDGVRRIFLGYNISYWLHKFLLLDAISTISRGKIESSLKRYILIDIDDIFVGKKRLIPSDVEALLQTQSEMKKVIPGFHFNLGYSGGYFQTGDSEQNRADHMLIENADKFWWFPHTWQHIQPHLVNNVTELKFSMNKNKQFAIEKGLNISLHYSVSPHHSGVYPVHEELFDAWRDVWQIQVTSTEEYPHLYPAYKRKGFIHKNVMVLPRQTCGLFTHTIYLDKYPGGSQKLKKSIFGGELAETVIFNEITIFMTHMPNYTKDRLALYTFKNLVRFLKCWTNLKLKTLPPIDLGKLYFNMYTDEKLPVWGNPCDDKRHQAIWSEVKSCDRLPKFLIIGPQKTGTTALYTFLKLHPFLSTSEPSIKTFEEVQFFSSDLYLNGVDWYMNIFNHSQNRLINFEKSATYFDNEFAPERAYALLPKAKIVAIIINPILRAYSWYQHVKSKGDVIANKYSFHDVITADKTSDKHIYELRNRCLRSGDYAHHLEKWLNHYHPSQLLILDGDELKNDPITTMDKVQLFLNIDPYLDYTDKLIYIPRKRFFCPIAGNKYTKCLGAGKGRVYPSMDIKSYDYLKQYYNSSNDALARLLDNIGQVIPKWLIEN